MEKRFKIIKLGVSSNPRIWGVAIQLADYETYDTHGEAHAQLQNMDDDGVFAIIECFIKENSK